MTMTIKKVQEMIEIAKRELKRKPRALVDIRVEAVPMRTEHNVPPADMPT
jgi:hypothetical protein